MSFDWKEYIKLAEELIKRDEEACLRSAISRSYYGVFCLTRNKLGYQRHLSGSVHGKVIDACKSSTDITQRKIGWNLDELRKKRNNADYDDTMEIKKSMAETVLVLAKQVLTNLKD